LYISNNIVNLIQLHTFFGLKYVKWIVIHDRKMWKTTSFSTGTLIHGDVKIWHLCSQQRNPAGNFACVLAVSS